MKLPEPVAEVLDHHAHNQNNEITADLPCGTRLFTEAQVREALARQADEIAKLKKQRMELLKLLEVAQDDLILLSRCANVDHKERASIAAIKTAMAAIGKAEGGEG